MITIREMQIDDLEQVMPIEEANFSIPWTETGFFTFLIRDDALFLVAEEDGEILGYLGILISFDESEITNVCVAEKARRRGIGRALMEELFHRTHRRFQLICVFVVFPHFSSSRVSKNVSFFVPDTKQKSDSPVSCRL